MTAKRFRFIATMIITLIFLLAWVFPIVWSVLNSLKTDQDVLAYPPKLIFHPTLEPYRDVLFGSGSILPNLISSFIISIGTTVITMLMAVPAAYALARLRFRGKKFAGFYVLATQMLPPVGIIIPYFLVLRNIGWIDTYQGIILIYLSFSLPFAIWLLVSYFEDIPFEMEEAAYLDGASRMRTLWRIIIPQGARRHRRYHRVRVPQCLERISVRRRSQRQYSAASHCRDVQFRVGRTDAVGEARGGLGTGDAASGHSRHYCPEEHRQGPHGRRRQGRRSPMTGRGQVRFEDIVKMHGEFSALKGVTFDIEPGEFFALLGPSGSGKSTTLRILAGLDAPTSGRVYMDGRDITATDARDRDIAMVFQSYALYPHMTVYENIAFPLEMAKLPAVEIDLAVKEAARKVKIEHLLDRKPGQLSGGQQQRCALARAIVRKARLFLLDEPLSNLDAKLRMETRAELKKLQRSLGVTAVYVTHDQEEAMTLADRMAVFMAGEIRQVGRPA
jgi:ABC-type nitrate/sulfonate/bicarbonate transport system ATPase subunit/ABC-type spermidine/putrescine transport system permease subunit II